MEQQRENGNKLQRCKLTVSGSTEELWHYFYGEGGQMCAICRYSRLWVGGGIVCDGPTWVGWVVEVADQLLVSAHILPSVGCQFGIC